MLLGEQIVELGTNVMLGAHHGARTQLGKEISLDVLFSQDFDWIIAFHEGIRIELLRYAFADFETIELAIEHLL